jgi:hypothetical protein
LELELGSTNDACRQLEAALAEAAEEVERMRTRFVELLPMGLDEELLPAAGDTAALDPVDEPTVESEDNSDEEEESAPQLTAVQQWSQLWGHAKVKAQAKAKAAKAMAKALDPATDWDLETFRRTETATKNRRAVPVTSGGPTGRPFDKGKKGPIKHARQGLLGAVQFWARGSRQNVVILLMKLIRLFGVETSDRN